MADLRVVAGECWIHFAFDAAAAIDLERAEAALHASIIAPGASTEREVLSEARRTSRGMQFRPRPLRLALPCSATEVAAASDRARPEVEITLYDFGAVSIAYRVVMDGMTLEELRALSQRLSDDASLASRARARADGVVRSLGDAASRTAMADPMEDYLVFHVREWASGDARDASALGMARAPRLDDVGAALASILRAADEALSESEIADALACTIAYGRRDLAVIDWNAAILFEPDLRSSADIIAVLEFANVELLELRFLDDRLDSTLERAYRDLSSELARPRADWRGAFGRRYSALAKEQRRLAALQMDSALLFEGVNNALKLLGDQYLARVYRLTARRFHLAEWDATILRKIETLQRLYEKTSDAHSTRRMEILEWIIIILIALSIVFMFVPGGK